MKRHSLPLFLIFLSAGVSAKDIELKVRPVKGAVSLDPFDAAWSKVEGVEIQLMPQALAPPGGGGAVGKVLVKALQSRHDLYFRLEWEDKAVDDYPAKAEGFSDAVALQFPAQPEAIPSPLMGDKDGAVVIWRWSASAQKDHDAGYRSAAAGHPRTYAEIYPYADDATFRAGEKAGNIVSQRRRASPVENLAARGFGTLTPTDDQPVEGKGVWKKGRWHAVMRRAMAGTPAFLPGSRLVFAAAVWDGGAGERNGMKSVCLWRTLALPGAPPRPPEDSLARGHRVFRYYGCAACHGQDALGGVRNPNAQTDPIPALNRVKEGFTKDELLAVILRGREPVRADPAGPPARLRMNAWETVMGPDEADALAEYLFSLMPKEKGEW